MYLHRITFLFILLFEINSPVSAQNIYPYPVKYITIDIDAQNTKMAFMDVIPANPNGQAVILFHGKNFTRHILERGY